MWCWRTGIAVLSAALWIPMAALAADMEPAGPRVQPPAQPSPYDWTITLGAEGRVEPIFEGSKDFRVRPYPVGDIRRFGTPERFGGPRDGIGFGLFDNGNLTIGPV